MAADSDSIRFHRGEALSAKKLNALANSVRGGLEMGAYAQMIPGLPIMRRRRPTDVSGFRMAQITAVNATTFGCKWLDETTGAAIGEEFEVNLFSYTNDDNSIGQQDPAACFPSLPIGHYLRVIPRTLTIFNGTENVTGYWTFDLFYAWCE